MNQDTPYPITTQPQFTYEPGGQEWLWVGVLAIVAITIVVLLLRKKKSSKTRAYQVLLKELDGIAKSDPALVATRSSSIIKRALQLHFPDTDFLALSASEVENLLQTDKAKNGITEIHELAKILTELEHTRFSGNATPNMESIRTIARLISNIMVHLQKTERKNKRPPADEKS